MRGVSPAIRGVYQNPPEGTGVTFAEIADVFAMDLAVPYTAVFGTRLEQTS